MPKYKNYSDLVASGASFADPNTPHFQISDVASAPGPPGQWSAENLFKLGIDSNGIVKTVAYHYYQTNDTNIATLMHHGIITKRINQRSVPTINYLNTNHSGVEFTLDEDGVDLGPKDETYQSVLGTALWKSDLMLYAMTVGVKRMHFQQLTTAYQSMWLPHESAGTPAQTFATWYSMPLIADFIGNSENAQVSQITATGADTDLFTSYASYDGNTLGRVAFVNFNFWNDTTGGTRPQTTVTLNVPAGTTSVMIKYLNHPNGATGIAGGISYGGNQWTAQSMGVETPYTNNTVNVIPSGGSAQFNVPYSSAAVAFLSSS